MVREEKERELESLRQKLTELQSETSHAISEREHLLANRIAPQPPAPGLDAAERRPSGGGLSTEQASEKKKLDGVKQRFRDRMAARKKMTETEEPTADRLGSLPRQQQPPRPQHMNQQASLVRTAGEEMYQQLDFYERSLKSVTDR